MSTVELLGVSRRFGSVAAVDGVTLRVPSGTRTAIVGPSGSGKSTLLRILAGFEAPDAGQVRLDGALLADGPASVPAHQRAVGLVAQEGALFPHLTVADNIGFGIGRRAPDRADRISALAGLAGLDAGMLRRFPDALSGGQQQRVALVRALACQPRLMLLDEPFSALDAGLRASTRQAVSDLLERAAVTTILVTHDQEEALSFADQVVVLQRGRLLQAGSPRDLYLRPCSEQVARFIGEAVILPAQLGPGWAQCALGRVSVDGPQAPGPARLMLRPEQIVVAPPGERPDGHVLGRVDGVSFQGPTCAIHLRLEPAGRPDDPGPLTLRVAGGASPPKGSAVWLSVTGPGHVLPG